MYKKKAYATIALSVTFFFFHIIQFKTTTNKNINKTPNQNRLHELKIIVQQITIVSLKNNTYDKVPHSFR